MRMYVSRVGFRVKPRYFVQTTPLRHDHVLITASSIVGLATFGSNLKSKVEWIEHPLLMNEVGSNPALSLE